MTSGFEEHANEVRGERLVEAFVSEEHRNFLYNGRRHLVLSHMGFIHGYDLNGRECRRGAHGYASVCKYGIVRLQPCARSIGEASVRWPALWLCSRGGVSMAISGDEV